MSDEEGGKHDNVTKRRNRSKANHATETSSPGSPTRGLLCFTLSLPPSLPPYLPISGEGEKVMP